MSASGWAWPRAGRRVVINGRFMARSVTGVERFAWEMVKALDGLRAEGQGADIAMAVFCPPAPAPLPCFKTIACRRVGLGGGYFWEQVALPAAAAGALVVNLCSLAPLAARKVTVIHDANVWLTPESYTAAFRWAYRVLLPAIARTSGACATVSQYSRKMLHQHGIAGRQAVHVIPNGCDHMMAAAEGETDGGVSLPPRFVFALGSDSPAKNLGVLAAIAPRLREHGVHLVMAGGSNRAVFSPSAATGADDGVIRLGRVSDGTIRHAMRHAVAFAFPSLFEGFGIPPLEAMALGCPVVSSNSSAMPEVLGGAALYCDPRDPEAWLGALLRLAGDEELRRDLARRGHRQVAAYTWRRAARRLLDIIEEQA